MQMSKEREWYTTLFNEFERDLNGQSKTSLHRTRKEAIRWFSQNGFPTVQQEEWRFTNVSPIGKIEFKPIENKTNVIDPAIIDPFLISKDFIRLVFVDGCYSADLSNTTGLAQGLLVQNLNDALAVEKESVEKNLAKHARIDENGFVALNTAFIKQGAFIQVSKNIISQQPVHLIYLATDKADERATHPRNLIVAENNSQFSVIESYVSPSDSTYFTNPVTEIVAGENAVIDHYKIQQESPKAYHTSLTQIAQKASSNYRSHNYVFGGAIVRNDLNAVLDGEGIECTLNGLYLACGNQLVDNHSAIEHAQPHCDSRELYKGILDEKARAVFSGKIHVHKDAQKTDAVQSNQNLILSEDAMVDTKPQLEIYADDVKCTHGGTVGQMDEDGVFYLRARGISEATAKNLMIQAFAGDVTGRIQDKTIREHIENIVQNHLAEGHIRN